MNFIVDLITNKIFLTPAIAWGVAQGLKMIIDSFKGGFCKERFKSSSGMPSAHAALVTSLVIMTGAKFGGDSFEFVMALFFAIIVIYDARGVRYETQRQGRALNNLNEEREEEGKQPLDIFKFNEKVGHTMPELAAGMLIGLICSIVVYHLPF